MTPLKHPTSTYVRLSKQGLGPVAIGKQLNVDEATVRRHLRKTEGTTLSHVLAAQVPDQHDGFNEQPLVVSATGGWAITADWHVPIVDYNYVSSFLDHAARLGIRQLIIGGDFLHMDALSSFDSKQDDAGLEREIEEAVRLLSIVADQFDDIVYIWGNHDSRLHKALGYTVSFSTAMKMVFGQAGTKVLDKVRFSNLDHMIIEAPNGEWRVCHPKSYNRNPLVTAKALAAIYGGNIITAHSHHCAVGHAVNGTDVICEIGGLFDRERTEYLKRTTTHPLWQQGYALLDSDGRLVVESPGWSTRL